MLAQIGYTLVFEVVVGVVCHHKVGAAFFDVAKGSHAGPTHSIQHSKPLRRQRLHGDQSVWGDGDW